MADEVSRLRSEVAQRVDILRSRGMCPTCRDLEHGDVFEPREALYEDTLVVAVLESFPRMLGHTIVIYKPHVPDLSYLDDADLAHIMTVCTRLMRGLKKGLGAEKVYLNTMCDGEPNHLHLQLFPRYPGEKIGSSRFVLPRGVLQDEANTVQRVRNALQG